MCMMCLVTEAWNRKNLNRRNRTGWNLTVVNPEIILHGTVRTDRTGTRISNVLMQSPKTGCSVLVILVVKRWSGPNFWAAQLLRKSHWSIQISPDPVRLGISRWDRCLSLGHRVENYETPQWGTTIRDSTQIIWDLTTTMGDSDTIMGYQHGWFNHHNRGFS